MKPLSPAWLRVFSAFFVNFSVAWFSAVFIVSNFTEKLPLPVLTLYTFYGIVCLIVGAKIEEELEKYG